MTGPMIDAATEIKRKDAEIGDLKAENAKLRTALRTIADWAMGVTALLADRR